MMPQANPFIDLSQRPSLSADPVATLPQPYQMLHTRHGFLIINQKDAYIGQSFLHYGEYSYEEWTMLADIMQLSPGHVVEVGANIGAHTLGLAKTLAASNARNGTDYQVHAFEPQPFIHQQLCANLALNAMFNTLTYPYACGEAASTVTLPIANPNTENNFGGIGIVNKAHAIEKNMATFDASCVTLDSCLSGISHAPIGLLKIDVEGFELQVLKGAQGILNTQRPVLYVENDQPARSRALIEYIQQHNYNVWWHIPKLYSSNNFYGNPHNIFAGVASFNMLALPKESLIPVVNLLPVVLNQKHPLEAA